MNAESLPRRARRGAKVVDMPDVFQAARCVATTIRLQDCLKTAKQLCGDTWSEKSLPYRTILNGVIATEGCSVLQAALPIANAMSSAGESPLMLLAVAAEMCEENAGLHRQEEAK